MDYHFYFRWWIGGGILWIIGPPEIAGLETFHAAVGGSLIWNIHLFQLMQWKRNDGKQCRTNIQYRFSNLPKIAFVNRVKLSDQSNLKTIVGIKQWLKSHLKYALRMK